MRRRRPRGLLDHRQSAPFPKVLEENQNHQLPRIDRYRRASSALLNLRRGNGKGMSETYAEMETRKLKRDKRKTPPAHAPGVLRYSKAQEYTCQRGTILQKTASPDIAKLTPLSPAGSQAAPS